MRGIGWLVSGILVVVALASGAALARSAGTDVLVVHGGRPGDAWSRAFVRGLEAELAEGLSGSEWRLRQEYLDAGAVADVDSLAPLGAYFKTRYARQMPDALVADGEAACRFLLRQGEDIFPGVPLILSGVAGSFVDRLHPADIPKGRRVVAPLGVKATLDLALSLHPEARRVACLMDQTRESRAVAKVLSELLREHQGRIIPEPVDIGEGVSRAAALDRVRQLDASYVVLYAGFSLRDDDARLPSGLTLGELCAACPRPVYALTDLGFGQGIAGGKLADVVQSGRLAGSALLALLSPEKAAFRPAPVAEPRFLFDAAVLERFKIAHENLPPDSRIVATGPVAAPAASVLLPVGWAVAGLLLLAVIGLLWRRRAMPRRLDNFGPATGAGVDDATPEVTTTATNEAPAHVESDDEPAGCLPDAGLVPLLDELPDAVLVLLHGGELAYANAAARAWMTADPQALTSAMLTSEAASTCQNRDLTLLGPDGTERHVELRSHPAVWDGQLAIGATLHDATPRYRVEQSLRDAEELCRIVSDHTFDWELWIAEDGRLLYSSPSCERITGFARGAFTDDPDLLERIIHPEDRPLWATLRAVESKTTYDLLDLRIQHLDGRSRWVSVAAQRVYNALGAASGFRYSIRDVSDRKQVELQLQHHTLHDHLTGVGNRTLVMDRILLGLERCKRRDDYFFAVAFLGLDRFKLVNESLGHAVGDKVLAEIARRLVQAVRELDTVARFGGDEFVLLLEELSTPREATGVIKRILEAVSAPVVLDGRDLRVTASVGVVLSPADMNRPEDLLRNATIAMYRAKQAGRDRFKIFNGRMLDRAVWAMRMETDLRRALEANEFHLVFQPIVKLPDGDLVGFEALIRWSHPTRGLISPGEFIPVAEETGQIVELGQWVLQESCRTLAAWRRRLAGATHLLLSVNISGRQFSQPGLLDLVKRSLEDTGLPATSLKLEITETAIMDNAQYAIDKLSRLKNLGVALSIDDFGTGYSSMSYLQKFPLDNLKIDLSFVRMMEAAKENIEIVKLIIDLAHNLNLEVVAEGVENVLQSRLLTSLGCEYAQGYYFSRPLSRDAAEGLILEHAARTAAPRSAATA